MITTFCLNPSYDKTITVQSLNIGEVNRIQNIRTDMGGKGLNVAVAAHRLGLEVQCVGCMGQDNSAQLKQLISHEGIKADFLPVEGNVRTNLKVVCLDGQPVTELNEPGQPLSEAELDAFAQKARESTMGNEYCVLTGSLPPDCPHGFYHDLMMAIPNIPCILDTEGEKLLQGLKARPFLIKPNLSELEKTLGVTLRTLRAIRDAAIRLIDMGAAHVIVSMGGMGALLTDGSHTLFVPGVKVEANSTVGAGDAMVAGILLGLREEGSLKKAFRYGVAAGAASVMTPGTQLIRQSDFQSLLPQVKVQEV